MGTSIPVRESVVEAKAYLGFLVSWHLMLVLASHLSEGTNTLVDPLITIDLLAALTKGRC